MTLRRILALIAALAALPIYAHWGQTAYARAEQPSAGEDIALAYNQGPAK